ncbi:hypothetical protein GTQ40_00835 [Flavobacteriaceae bacterium R38]|nr:hypothetical protein [Flavobacteriaceae bacterium R38]
MTRKYFSGQISKKELLDNFPDYENDFKMRLLYHRIKNKPIKGWLFGVSKKTYVKYLNEIYEIIEDLETNTLRFKTMKRLFKELWIQSNYCSEPIEQMSMTVFEVAKSTSNSKEEIRRYLNILVDQNFIIKTSDKPLLYEFTEFGKQIKTDLDIEKIIKNVA